MSVDNLKRLQAIDIIARENVKVFLDTQDRIQEEEELHRLVRESIEGQDVNLDGAFEQQEKDGSHRFSSAAKVTVSDKRTLEAAGAYAGKKVCILNFANAFHAGGGVKSGATAQEESLCRISTLYANLTDKAMQDAYYRRHEAICMDYFGNDDCIFSPKVCVIKTDTEKPELLDPKDRYFVDVITCAAPDLRGVSKRALNPDRVLKLYKKRIRAILETAKKEGEDVLILGAFGCGAFQNNPAIVAEAFRDVLADYRFDFSVIEFAIWSGGREDGNIAHFRKAFEE